MKTMLVKFYEAMMYVLLGKDEYLESALGLALEGDSKMTKVIETTDGFNLVDRQGVIIGTYSRARDARRGARRRGLAV
jgi:hypothetical protein